MAFKASKKRGRKSEPVAEGKQLIPSAAIEAGYSRNMKGMIRAMAQEYRDALTELFDRPSVESHYAADAKLPTAGFKSLLNRLSQKWMKRFSIFADKEAKSTFVKINKHSFTTVQESLKTLGIKNPPKEDPDDFAVRMETYMAENVALIKSIPLDLHSKIERAVWNSLTAKEGESQGAYGIHRVIRDAMGDQFSRADLIARDQNAKLYSALNNARIEQAGCDTFDWVHSSAGKQPRQCHVAWNGRTFLTKGGPNELYELLPDGTVVKYEVGQDGARKGDIAKPGHAINCKCRAKPVIKLSTEWNEGD